MSTVAVVLCNYNHGKYLAGALDLICRQTRSADQIVIVDDGSTDNSWHIIRSFAQANPQVEAYANCRNLGLQPSIAYALSKVRCEYLVWTAADDRLLVPFLHRNMAVLARHPEAALSFSEVVSLKGDTDEIDRLACHPTLRSIFDLSDLPEFLSPGLLRSRMRRTYLPISSNTVVVRVDRLREFGGYPPELRWYADSFTYTALAMRFGACVIGEPLALIRSTPGSYSGAMYDLQKQRAVLRSILELLSRPEFRDIRMFVRNCPSNLSVYGSELIKLLARRIGDWDLALAYLLWRISDSKRRRRLTWLQFLLHLSRRAGAMLASQ